MWSLTALLVVALGCSAVSALQCAVCKSPKSADCSDPFNSTIALNYAVDCSAGQFCRKVTYTDEGESHVDRSCAELPKGDEVGCGWEIRVNSRIGSGWDCFCTDDMCNAATAGAGAGAVVLAAALALVGAL